MAGKNKSILAKAVSSYNDYMFMPIEFRNKIADKNLSSSFYALIITSSLCLLDLVILTVMNVKNLENVRYHLIFLSIYLIVAFCCMILYVCIKKFKLKSFIVKEMPFYIAFTLGIIDCLISLYLQGDLYTEIMVLIIMFIMDSIVFTVHPFYFLLFVVVGLYRLYPRMNESFGIAGVFASIVVFGTILVLVVYKWINSKRLFIKEQNIEFYKEALQSEVERQTNEIVEQHRKLVDMQDNTIIGLSNLVENRDSETGSHVRRTSAYVSALAKKVKEDRFYSGILTDKYIEYITKAAPMHDIGKIIVADNILKKKGKLTDDEFSLMKLHTIEGARIVDEVFGSNENEDYVEVVKEIVTSHHEKWNGSGYPNGLKCNEIPLSARIMAIADVFDALVSPRCYKEPFPVDKAFEIIKASSGTHFDPILVTEFQRIRDDIIDIMNEYSD
ncbi:MAG: HD domain-containing protein [Treponemataceae bacterium]|nr:HD domain-containing protein [Treponemataceae bacterium]